MVSLSRGQYICENDRIYKFPEFKLRQLVITFVHQASNLNKIDNSRSGQA